MSIQPNESHIQPPHAPRRSAGLPVHVLLVDDHPALRRGVRQLIDEQPDLATVGEAASAAEAVGELARWADVVVVDYHLGGHDGLWLTGQLKRRRSHPPRVLIYSAFADHALALAAMIAGADGLLSKAALDQEICIAIRRLARGRQHFPAVPAALAAALRSRLEHGDQAIFDMLIHGLGAREVSGRLGIAAAELEARREVMLRAIAHNPGRARSFHAACGPLDYQRARRRPRYRAA